MRESLCVALQAEGYEVFEAPNRKAALELLPKIKRPCVSLLDLEMLVMDGAEFLQRLGQRPDAGEFSAILCTASGYATFPGVRRVLVKPFGIVTLLSAVQALCRKSRAAR